MTANPQLNEKEMDTFPPFHSPRHDMDTETHLLLNDTKLQNFWASSVGSSIGGRVTVGSAVMLASHCECISSRQCVDFR